MAVSWEGVIAVACLGELSSACESGLEISLSHLSGLVGMESAERLSVGKVQRGAECAHYVGCGLFSGLIGSGFVKSKYASIMSGDGESLMPDRLLP